MTDNQNTDEARLAPEPVFSVSKDLDFQNFHSVFRSGLVEPALSNAVMLSLAFAASGGVINKECLIYRGQAIHHIRETMALNNKSVSESTIGAILLLVGVEARDSNLRLTCGVANTSGTRLTEGIKRAIFWQDLNSSIVVGSKRIFNHKTFAELEWERNSVTRDLLQLPPGLQIRSHLFSDEFIEVLEDIYALERIRDDYRPADCVVSAVFINGQTASIQSRLEALLKETQISRCCYLGAYLCSVMLCCTVWCALVIPHNTSSTKAGTSEDTTSFVRVDVVDVSTRYAELLQILRYKTSLASLSTINDCNRKNTSIKMTSKNVFITGTTGFIGGDAFYALTKAQPSWKYTILVRSEEKGKDVQKQYPDVKLAIGSLDDSDVIKKAASEADIVIHTADSSDHAGAARAIGAGLQATHSASNPGYWIHVSGTGILCWYDQDNKRYGEAPLPEQSYDDLEGVDKVTSLPDTAFHRDVDKIVLEEAAKNPDAVKVAIVCPPTIYGTGRGPINQRSRQIPGLAETTLEKGFGPIIGAGKTEWDNVHVHDLSTLFVLLSQRAASSDNENEQEIWGPKGYFFAENGTHKWSAISTLLAKEAKKQGLIDSDETKVLDVDEAQEKLGFQALSWGLNSRGDAKRARKYLGWKPESPSLEEWLPEAIQVEARRLKKI
ncbi:unnamed protein product [Fusarium graminearum]|nr:unnamed protein product [Fusarium graminearum]